MGKRIAKLRKEKGLTQEKLAELCNIDISYIGQIERGLKTPSLKVLFRISNALSLKLEELLSWEEKK
ncbi:helix-turn-helix domain-containing protein [Thermovibrio guaymasensis]|uniref:helix-turn-helix domain-containing protein n=1 Tax=Thermovibrio guaymasensis TaxID=240167 RepID=UPI001B87BC42|nr:helix-turn-helix transcriptional regulator [Thermovibrio guaymasensis]